MIGTRERKSTRGPGEEEEEEDEDEEEGKALS